MPDERIELPPCPDCGCAVNDLHVVEALEVSLYRFESRYEASPMREIELLPCKCKVSQYTLQVVKGAQRVTEIHMQSGWKWTLGWSQTEAMILHNTVIPSVVRSIEQGQQAVLTAGQTPGYNPPHADDQDQDPDQAGGEGDHGGPADRAGL